VKNIIKFAPPFSKYTQKQHINVSLTRFEISSFDICKDINFFTKKTIYISLFLNFKKKKIQNFFERVEK